MRQLKSILAFLFVLLPVLAYGQVTQLSGPVKNNANAAVPNATVTFVLTNCGSSAPTNPVDAAITTSGFHATTTDATLLSYSGSTLNGLTLNGGPDAITGLNASDTISRTISGNITGTAGTLTGTFNLGATDDDLAEFFKVHRATIYRWAAKHKEFCDALKAGKDPADDRVERSLYHRAVGYTHDAVKIFLPRGATEAVIVPYKEHVPPDTTAAIFWLKNRRKSEWRDRQEHAVGLPSDFDNMTNEQLAEFIARGSSPPGESKG